MLTTSSQAQNWLSEAPNEAAQALPGVKNKRPDLSEADSEVVSSPSHQSIEGITKGSAQEVTIQAKIAFQMANGRLDGGSGSE